MENVKQKKRPGRPATGHTPIVALRLAAEEIQVVDELAAELKVDRSKALRVLLRHGLAAYNRKKNREETTRRKAAAAVEAANAAIVDEVLEEQAWHERVIAAPRRQAGRAPTREHIKAVLERAEQASRERQGR